jgi:DNA invertase Pin-like site-specific DNA recombinase
MGDVENEIDVTKLRYVLYARKSTSDESRQIRSIGDQITECKDFARYRMLKVVDVIEESKSAKKPNQRPLFRKMLDDIRKGKYDGIIAWNPDRLARNMLEGGEIIDLVDQKIIKDLKFVTHHFTDDANGKMLLGMAFVLSKQYSDDLSQKVTRGVRNNFLEGKTPTPKHGYLNEDRLYKPDGKNFDLLQEGWKMRSEGIGIEEIAVYLNANGYTKRVKRSGKEIKIKKQILSKIFKDPFYYGVLVQAQKEIDLRDLYNFEAMITEDVYNKVQQLTFRRIKPNKQHHTAFYPLKAMIRCSFCGSNMYVSPSTGSKGGRYLSARCDNKECLRKKRAIRTHIVFNFIYDFLDKGLNFTEKEYNEYYSNMADLSDSKREDLNIEIHRYEGFLKKTEFELKETSLNIVKLQKTSPAWKINSEQINKLAAQIEESKEIIKKLRQRLTNPVEDKLSLEDFLNLSKNAGAVVKSADAVVKDQICRIIFTNLFVDEGKVTSYQLKEPFATLIKQRELSLSRGGETILQLH